jgi:two-component system, NarL family, invasion response regulator UvrY
VLSILIGDDHPMFRRGTRDVLYESFESVMVEEAETGTEMIAKAAGRQWDAFIMDVTMPDRSGTDLLEDLLRVCPGTPVLVFSVHPERTYAARMIRSGARGYLNKATGSDQLITALRTILDGRRYLSPEVAECLVKTVQADCFNIPHELLSNREFQILQLLGSGRSLKEIAGQLSVSTSAVSTYRARLLKKLGVRSNAELARYALEKCLID